MANRPDIPILPETPDILRARQHWQYTGTERPDFALAPGSGQESVWDYPRPPALVAVTAELTVYAAEQLVARTRRGMRVLETAGAPTYYFPPDDVDQTLLAYGELTSICEWKGVAQTITVAGIADAGWRYAQMFPAFADIYLWPSFYPNKLRCFVDDEAVTPQPGGYYGGWVTKAITGPIKGEPGSQGW